MAGLLDHIFANIDHIKQDRDSVKAYLNYLKEILGQEASPEKRISYLELRIQLEQRVLELDAEEIQMERHLLSINKSGK